ncbi:MAG: hypothetical protein GWM98_25130 [Nitrospinaceae bacterium]|nr:hypothetical protein [Nitrospinaceae bacterium]NIR57151.1 hypothetical protein [Nitrospinaceae bacterium]NIS87593.1 hypothetical protein [Nitrospinaceae bacterium]NIT84464.1 hypothetical protein [Nitrospinaceae bacterium]NIU46650.1 hypothetical protein [Nitrospinaceae bacterium]
MNSLGSIRRFPFSGFVLGILLATALLAAASSAGAAGPERDRFLKRVQSALDRQDLAAFKKLFNWEGVSDDLQASLDRHLFNHLFDHPVESVELIPLPADFRTEYVLNGVRHYANVEIMGLVKVNYRKGAQGRTSLKIPYGKKGNRYLFAGTVRETVNPDAPPSKQIQVIIIGFGHPPVTFEGYMLYLQNQTPVRKNLKDMGGGNLTQLVRGEDITFLKVWRTSAQGSIQIEILIDGKTIYKTQPLDTRQPIIFNR